MRVVFLERPLPAGNVWAPRTREQKSRQRAPGGGAVATGQSERPCSEEAQTETHVCTR